MKKGDFIIIGFVLILAFVFSFSSKLFKNQDYDKSIVNISVNNNLYGTYEINSDTNKTLNIDSDLGHNTIEISNGDVWVSESDCHNQICVLDGKIKVPGEILVCLPNKLLIEIEGVKNIEVDGVAY